ncbi:MAG: alpha/beta hydrolase-fold protein [Flavobacteriales bacterium]
MFPPIRYADLGVLCFAALLPVAGFCQSKLPTTGPGDGEPFVLGVVRSINSNVLGQTRTLNIYLPEGYHDTTATYPVIYVLDGSANEDFPHIAGLAQYMNMYDLLPKSIVVGIANVDRSIDFTAPTHNDSDRVWVPHNGGSARFIDFLEKEVQPFVEANYRTAEKRTIIGQSLGGLLATQILFTRPDLFDDYILVSPSLWWDNGSLAAGADAWVKAHATLPKRVYIALAPDDAMMQKEIDEVVKAFSTHAKPPFIWWYVPFPEESHLTILHRSLYRAFELMNGGK